ncbi:hypothetical protein D3C80_1466710 [compost metagenome]
MWRTTADHGSECNNRIRSVSIIDRLLIQCLTGIRYFETARHFHQVRNSISRLLGNALCTGNLLINDCIVPFGIYDTYLTVSQVHNLR